MPTPEDSPKLVPLPAADISELDRVLVFHAASNTTRATPASEFATTPEGVVAALVDANLEVASIGLSDGTGLALADGSLTLNADGQVVIHDNDSNTEDLPHLVSSREHTAFASVIESASMDGVTFSQHLLDFPFKGSEVANNLKVIFRCSLNSFWSLGGIPDGGAYLALCKEGQDPTVDGLYYPIAEGVTSEARHANLSVVFSVASGTWTLANFRSGPQAIVSKNNAGTITHAAAWENGVDVGSLSPITGTVGDPFILKAYLVTYDTGGAVASFLEIAGSFDMIIVP